ncbi:hypothetical protein HPP92_002583 [Vanilla planifolia]|uniref:WD repeat-containing protein 44 n=1 Tax=Vanilla planifolia TaxID=51239 RepID=A0A835S5K6_VANPL|nr:hypothetical protein HPP92_002583 [Vanilla planifolia]
MSSDLLNSAVANGSASSRMKHGVISGSQASKRMKKGVYMGNTRSSFPDYIVLPETVFSLSEKPVCSLEGHVDDILDLCWSESSQYLISSSMDKTVRLWDMKSKACLKLFVHSDYLTYIHFSPIDDNYFISGSLDGKVRLWNIPDRQVVD